MYCLFFLLSKNNYLPKIAREIIIPEEDTMKNILGPNLSVKKGITKLEKIEQGRL
jgi:hypothetical protein